MKRQPLKKTELKELRKFGVLVGTIFVLIGLAPLRKGLAPRQLIVELGAFSVLVAALQPGALRYLHQAWMKIGEVLGWINTRILLTLVFFVILTPIALARRLAGARSMSASARAPHESYMEPAETRDPKHVELQY
jgi:hypothetical protein